MNYNIIIDGEISRWGFSKQYVRGELAKYKGKHVDMRISSLGGDLDHGLDIRQQLIEHGDVTAYLYGFVASSATVIALGAKRICMSKYALFLVHKCSNFVDAWGCYNADQMQQLIDELTANKRENDKIDVILAQMYAGKCKKSVSDILDVLKRGEWLTAQEALDYGFIDEIIDDEDAKINFTPELKAKFNAYNLPIDRIEKIASPEQSTQSMLAQILDSIKTLFKSNAQSQTSIVMTETAIYPAVMAAIGVEKLAVATDGAVSISQASMEALNAAIDKANADIASRVNDLQDRDAKIAQLEEQVENLKKLPADTTSEVKDDCTDGYMSTDEVYNIIKDL